MPYIGSDGNVHQNRPWGLQSITDMFWGFVGFFVMFFKTLTEPLLAGIQQGDARRGSGGGGGGGSGGPGGPGGPRGGGPRRFGNQPRVMTISDCAVPGGG